MISKLFIWVTKPLIRAIQALMLWLSPWLEALYKFLSDAVNAIIAYLEVWFRHVFEVIAQLAGQMAGLVHSATGFDITIFAAWWDKFWQGVGVVEFFLPVTACAAILLTGVQIAIGVRVVRWLLSCIPWPTANG